MCYDRYFMFRYCIYSEDKLQAVARLTKPFFHGVGSLPGLREQGEGGSGGRIVVTEESRRSKVDEKISFLQTIIE